MVVKVMMPTDHLLQHQSMLTGLFPVNHSGVTYFNLGDCTSPVCTPTATNNTEIQWVSSYLGTGIPASQSP